MTYWQAKITAYFQESPGVLKDGFCTSHILCTNKILFFTNAKKESVFQVGALHPIQHIKYLLRFSLDAHGYKTDRQENPVPIILIIQ